MGFLNGKKLLITGVISNRSIAYGIAKACRREGAELAFTYANERYRERIEGLAADFDSKLVYRMDVGSDEDIAAVVEELGKAWGGLDGFVHSIGFAPRENRLHIFGYRSPSSGKGHPVFGHTPLQTVRHAGIRLPANENYNAPQYRNSPTPPKW